MSSPATPVRRHWAINTKSKPASVKSPAQLELGLRVRRPVRAMRSLGLRRRSGQTPSSARAAEGQATASWPCGVIASRCSSALRDQILRDPEVAARRAAEEAGGRPGGQQLRLVIEELMEMRSRVGDRPHRAVDSAPLAAHAPGGRWPAIAGSELAPRHLRRMSRRCRSRSPIQRATGVLTALPTSFHRSVRRRPWHLVGRPQSSRRGTPGAARHRGCPESRSCPVPGCQIAGGDGMPIVEPPLSVGMASTAHPRPRMPSVQ